MVWPILWLCSFTGSMLLSGLVPELPESYLAGILRLKSLAARTLVLELEKPFFNDDTYWLNINEKEWPMLAVVEHTNLVDPKTPWRSVNLYIGKYLDSNSPLYSFQGATDWSVFSYLDKLFQGFTNNHQFLGVCCAFAQPVVEVTTVRCFPVSKPVVGTGPLGG